MFISKKMRYFMVIMEKKNFSSAAEALYITRSPLSKMISDIETSLGGKLFLRKHNVLEPTPLAWEIYYKCKPLYEKLSVLVDEYSKQNEHKLPEIVFDIGFPDNFYKTLKMICKSKMQGFLFNRKVISHDEILELKNTKGKWIVSFRDLGDCTGVYKEQWETGELVLLYSEMYYAKKQNYPPVYIWKESATEFLKERFAYAIKDDLPDIQFIEHSYDIPTLMYLIKEGQGAVLFTQKLAAMYKLDGLSILKIKNYHPRLYLYSGSSFSSDKKMMEFKKILNKFI